MKDVLYRLHRPRYFPMEDSETTITLAYKDIADIASAGMDEYLTLGHSASNEIIEKTYRYKFVQRVGNEIHEHILLTCVPIEAAVAGDIYLIRSKATPVLDGMDAPAKIYNYSHSLIGYLKDHRLMNSCRYSDEQFISITEELLRRLRHLLLTHFVQDDKVIQRFDRAVLELQQKGLYHVLPSSVNDVFHLFSRLSEIYTAVFQAKSVEVIKRHILEWFDPAYAKYNVGIIAQMCSGTDRFLDHSEFPDPLPTPVRTVDRQTDDIVILNPQFCNSLALTYVCYGIIDIMGASTPTDISFSIELRSGRPVTINFELNHILGTGNTFPYDCHPSYQPDQNWLCGIDFKTILTHLRELSGYLPIKTRGPIHVTVCKTFNELLSVCFDIDTTHGTRARVTYIMDMLYAYILNPALITYSGEL